MRERTFAAKAMWPLAVIAAVFFLPTYASCDGPPKSPAAFADDPFMFAAIVPVFFAAAVLALLTFRALRRGEPDRRARRLALLSVALVPAGALGTTALMTAQNGSEWPWLASAAAGAAAAVFALRRARGQQPWRIWLHLLIAFSAVAAVTMPSIIIGADLVHGDLNHLGPGAYLFLAAQPVLAALAIAGLRAGRRT